MCAGDFIYPRLFPHYFGNSLHDLPYALQVADLGGPVLITGLLTAANAALYELLSSYRRGRVARVQPLSVGVLWGLSLIYGAYRVHEVDARAATADKLRVGLVQADMGLFQKRNDPIEGLRRHIEQSEQLEREHDLDLIVWPESAFAWFMPDGLQDLTEVLPIGTRIHSPLLFGGLARREIAGEKRPLNTAFLADRDGTLRGTYDKTYLLAFGEYIPLGDTFPILYEWSPNSGHFAQGTHVKPLVQGKARIGTLICYEDIIPEFVRRVMRDGEPNVLVNLTNDAWFGDTHAPWEHLALAKLRSVEHHRALVRATNSGVSAVVDPVGRLVAKSGVFTRENLVADVPLMEGSTVYGAIGDVLGWLSLLAALVILVRAHQKRAQAA
jgi:apolipoprotein N-acyltransferase